MRVKVNVVKWVIMDKQAKLRIAKCEKDGLCYACMKPLYGRVVRKCHEKCMKATYRAIERGETTDEQRVSEGKLAAPQSGGCKPTNPVTIETRQALAGG
jgi:hypothetical protein